jgi:hypothetical protein
MSSSSSSSSSSTDESYSGSYASGSSRTSTDSADSADSADSGSSTEPRAPRRIHLGLSGGGVRASAFCAGVLGGILGEDGVEIATLSSVSGGGWASCALVNQWHLSAKSKTHDGPKDVRERFERVAGSEVSHSATYGKGQGGVPRMMFLILGVAFIHLAFTVIFLASLFEGTALMVLSDLTLPFFCFWTADGFHPPEMSAFPGFKDTATYASLTLAAAFLGYVGSAMAEHSPHLGPLVSSYADKARWFFVVIIALALSTLFGLLVVYLGVVFIVLWGRSHDSAWQGIFVLSLFVPIIAAVLAGLASRTKGLTGLFSAAVVGFALIVFPVLVLFFSSRVGFAGVQAAACTRLPAVLNVTIAEAFSPTSNLSASCLALDQFVGAANTTEAEVFDAGRVERLCGNGIDNGPTDDAYFGHPYDVWSYIQIAYLALHLLLYTLLEKLPFEHWRRKIVTWYFRDPTKPKCEDVIDPPIRELVDSLPVGVAVLINITLNTKLTHPAALRLRRGELSDSTACLTPYFDDAFDTAQEVKAAVDQPVGRDRVSVAHNKNFWNKGSTTLGRLMSISAGVFSPRLGNSVDGLLAHAIASILTFFNISFGLWIFNPAIKDVSSSAIEDVSSSPTFKFHAARLSWAGFWVAVAVVVKLGVLLREPEGLTGWNVVALVGVIIAWTVSLASAVVVGFSYFKPEAIFPSRIPAQNCASGKRSGNKWTRAFPAALLASDVLRSALIAFGNVTIGSHLQYASDGGHVDNIGIIGILMHLLDKGDIADDDDIILADASMDPECELGDIHKSFRLAVTLRLIKKYKVQPFVSGTGDTSAPPSDGDFLRIGRRRFYSIFVKFHKDPKWVHIRVLKMWIARPPADTENRPGAVEYVDDVPKMEDDPSLVLLRDRYKDFPHLPTFTQQFIEPDVYNALVALGGATWDEYQQVV